MTDRSRKGKGPRKGRAKGPQNGARSDAARKDGAREDEGRFDLDAEADGSGRPRFRFPRRPTRSTPAEPIEVQAPETVGGDPASIEAVNDQVRTPGGVGSALTALAAASFGSAATLMPGRRAKDPWAGEDMYELGVDRGSMVAATDGVPLAVREAGPVDAPMTVVFAHGYTLTMDTWHFQRRHLADRFGSEIRMVFYDQRGHGLSGKSTRENSTIEQLGRDLATVITATAPTGPVVVIGHSMGGMTVQSFVLQHRELVAERVLGAGLVATAKSDLTESGLGAVLESKALSNLASLATRTPGVFTSGRKALGAIISPLVYGGSFGDPATVSPTLARFTDKVIAATDVLTIANFFEALSGVEVSGAMEILRDVRTTVLCGDRDLLTPLDRSVDIVDELPDSEFVVVPGAGHMVMLEDPALVSEVLGDLVADAIVEWRERQREAEKGGAGVSGAAKSGRAASRKTASRKAGSGRGGSGRAASGKAGSTARDAKAS